MTSPNLSFEQAPPIDVPLRFLLTAPWFGVAAGLLLALTGDAITASRWTPQALSIVHLLVVGYLLQAMIGALFQFVPVAAGGNVWRPRLTAGVLHPWLIIAALLLAAGLYLFNGMLLRTAALLFVVAVLAVLGVIGLALVRTPAVGATIAALRLAVGGLAVTVSLGSVLAEGLAGSHPWALATVTHVHAAWGLAGWILMLVVGVSYFVVPMFQLTPPYPVRYARWLPWALLAVILLWSLQLVLPAVSAYGVVWAAGWSMAASYAFVTLRLQSRRRRKVSDATFLFFRVAMVCLLAAATIALLMLFSEAPQLGWWLGAILIVGVFVSLINGMAYKIVPFLCWLHLQRQAGIGGSVPNMREMLSERAQKGQFIVHVAAVGLVLLAGAWPLAAIPAGGTFALSSGWLGVNLLTAVSRYRRFRDRGRAGESSPGS